MSLLENTSNSPTGADTGNDSPSNRFLMPAIIGGLLVVAAIVIFFVYKSGQKPALAVGEIANVWAYPMHVVTADTDASGASITPEEFDQMLVFVQARVHNQAAFPLVISQVMTDVTMADGIHSSYAADLADYQRIFIAYPQLKSLQDQPLQVTGPLDPGQSTQGMMISAFRMSAADWAKHTAFDITFNFKNNGSIVLTPTTPILTPNVAAIPKDQLQQVSKKIQAGLPQQPKKK